MFIISIINEIFRALPLIGPIFLFLFYFCKNDLILLYILIGSILIIFINFIMKDIIFKYIESIINYYNLNKIQNILGIFDRPNNAKNCGIFYVNEENLSYERGMPSGHSLLAGYIGIVLYYYLIDKYKIKKKEEQNNLLIICLLFIFYTMYTRILFGCHTFQQTIIGCIIGIIYGHYYYKFSYKFIDT